jgi:hypothetical protein
MITMLTQSLFASKKIIHYLNFALGIGSVL